MSNKYLGDFGKPVFSNINFSGMGRSIIDQQRFAPRPSSTSMMNGSDLDAGNFRGIGFDMYATAGSFSYMWQRSMYYFGMISAAYLVYMMLRRPSVQAKLKQDYGWAKGKIDSLKKK